MAAEKAIVYSEGDFVEIKVPSSCALKPFLYATAFAHLTRVKKIGSKKAEQIAEAFVFKQLYPGLEYDYNFEQMLIF